MDQKEKRQKPVKEFLSQIEGTLNNDIVFTSRQKYAVEFSDDSKSYEFVEKSRLQSTHRYKAKKYDKYREIEQIGSKHNNKDVNGFLQQLRPKFQQGDPFVQFNENVLKYDAEQRKWLQGEILINKNEVTLVQLWDLEELNSIKELKNRVEEIDGAIRIISISKLDGKRKAAKIIHSLNKCEHYLLDSEVLPKTSPYSILINKYGNITFMGETIEFNLKKKIQTLLDHQVEEGQDEDVEEIEEIKQEDDDEQENTNYEKSIIEKEKFQQLKQKLKQYVDTVKQYNDKKTRVTLTLVKEQVFSKSWQLTERSNVLVDYKSPLEEQETLNSILDSAKELFNEDLKIFSSIQYDQQKEWEGFRQKLEELFENYGLDIPIYYLDQTQYKRINNQIKQIKRFALSVPKNSLTYEIFKSIKKDIKLYVKYNIYDETILEAAKQTYDTYLKRGYQLEYGDVLPDIEGFYLKDQEVSPIVLENKPTIILYFDPLDIDSKLQLQKVNQILQDNINFIGLSNRIQQDTEEFINKNQNLVEKLKIYFPESEYLQAFKQVEHSGYPYYIILDQNKRIRKIGRINNLQFVIDNILNNEIQEQYINNIDEIKLLYQSISVDKLNQDLQNAGQGKQFTFNLQFIDIYLSDKQGQPQQYSQSLIPQLSYFIRQDKLPILQEVLSWIFIVLPQNKFRVEEFISETFDIQLGQQCHLCQKELGDVPQYFEPYNNLSYCVECAEFDNQEEVGILRYKVRDNLIYINGQNQYLQNIDKHRIGNNVILQEGLPGDQWHNIDCEGCEENTQGPRYVSISTNPGKINPLDGFLDLCHSCFLRFKNKDQALLDEVVQQYPDFSFDAPLLRILFDHGYWVF